MFRFDCHAHVYETLHAVDGARYQPSKPAPLSDWLANLERNGLTGGVIVQVSFLGYDNSELLCALRQLDRSRFAGVAAIPLTTTDSELDDLCAEGVTGIRWNLVRGAKIPDLNDPTVRGFLSMLENRSMHLELHLESPRLATCLPAFLDAGPNIVVDHFGLPADPDPSIDPWIAAAKSLPDLSRLFVKFSGHYRSQFDVSAHAKVLSEILPAEQIVWGSDWPHTQFEDAAAFEMVADLRSKWSNRSSETAAEKLFGISYR